MANETILLLPGLLCDRAIWQAQIETLEPQFDIHVASFGTLASFAAMADHVLAEAPRRFSLAGHSMGGRVSLQIMRRAPERVDRLALLDTGTHGPRPGERAGREALARIAERDGMRALADAWLPPMVHPDRLSDAGLMDGLYAMVGRMTPLVYRAQMEALLGRPDAGLWLTGIACPTLVGVGSHDTWSPPDQHAVLAAAIEGATLSVFEGAGHMAPAEAPTAVSEALRSWMGRA